MLTLTLKLKVIDALKIERERYESAAKMAVAYGLNPAQLSRVLNGETEKILAESMWVTLARKLGVSETETVELKTARTPVFEHISAQLEACQNLGLSGLFCDAADIGKTHAAKWYVRKSKNAVYIDCSQVKSKQKLIRALAKEFGLAHTGRYADVYEDLVYYLRGIATPLIVLDEAGDLEYPAFLELKAIWNATEGACGWYMLGADGLRAKIELNLASKKVGYAELFSRFGSRYQKCTPDGGLSAIEFKKLQTALIAKANGAAHVQELYARTGGSLRRLRIELNKLKQNG